MLDLNFISIMSIDAFSAESPRNTRISRDKHVSERKMKAFLGFLSEPVRVFGVLLKSQHREEEKKNIFFGFFYL